MGVEPLQLLCVEPRFPGRLGAVADWLVRRRGYRCQFCFHSADPRAHWPESVGRGLDLIQFNVGGVAREPAVAWTRCLERGLCYAYGCWEMLNARRLRSPDLVLGRSAGLGSTLFAPVFAPRVPIVNLFDYFYHPHQYDLADDRNSDAPAEYFHWRRAANAMDFLDLENGVRPWVPMNWQRDLYPKEYRQDFFVLHDGVDTRRFSRTAGDPRIVAGREIPGETRVVTFVGRRTDRLRGFDRFLALANRLLAARQDVLCIVIGGATVERGMDVEFFGKDFRAHALGQTPPHDANRIWFLDSVPQSVVAQTLQSSDLHVYSSRAYSVSRSLLEAMAAGAVVLAWDTEPVREVIIPNRTGLLADNLDQAETIANAVLQDPDAHRALARAGETLIRERYAGDVTLPVLADFLQRHARDGR